jgi:epoxyqueuosine reductase
MSDYHRLIWKKGEKILTQIHKQYGNGTEVGRVVTDSAPLLERALARHGSRGFIGKNTCFISPKYGSMILLGEILTSLDIAPSHQAIENPNPLRRSKEGGCGTCRRCQVHCPTGALDQDYRIDARKCLAYWTIEHRGPIPEEFWPWLGLYVFGCDICQIVCPYNRNEQPRAPESLLKIKQAPALFEMATMTQESYEKLFGGTPVTRAKREGLIRNALIAMAVTEASDLQEAMKILSDRREGGVIATTLDQVTKWLHRRTSRL